MKKKIFNLGKADLRELCSDLHGYKRRSHQ